MVFETIIIENDLQISHIKNLWMKNLKDIILGLNIEYRVDLDLVIIVFTNFGININL